MNLERLVSAALTVCAIAIASALVHREFQTTRVRATPSAAQPPVKKLEWREALVAGTLIGEASAPIQVVEFADFECPFCKRFHESFEAVKEKIGPQVALSFVHFPLPMHRFARPAARSSECAREAGQFGTMASLLFRKQDSLGLKSWQSFAAEAGVRDSAGFAACVSGTATQPRVEAGLTVGEKFGVRSTPTVIINGWQYDVPPTRAVLESDIRALLAGKEPTGVKAAAK